MPSKLHSLASHPLVPKLLHVTSHDTAIVVNKIQTTVPVQFGDMPFSTTAAPLIQRMVRWIRGSQRKWNIEPPVVVSLEVPLMKAGKDLR